jgi:hypothetical protein
MTKNFRPDAVEFVRVNRCAATCPVDLVARAMAHGAAVALAEAAELILRTTNEMNTHRLVNNFPSSHAAEPRMVNGLEKP